MLLHQGAGTCEQIVMSGRILIGFVDSTVFLLGSDRVRFALARSFLVRNWCGPPATGRWQAAKPGRRLSDEKRNSSPHDGLANAGAGNDSDRRI
jgi:hypothetical protein